MEVSGAWKAAAREDGTTAFRGEFTLRHRGPAKSDDFQRVLADGSLRVESVFDPARGAVTESSYGLRARHLPDEGPVKDRKVTEVRVSGDLVLRRVRGREEPPFQEEVDAAIARGVKWLLAAPKDGAYEEYKNYPGGVDGLAALALYACDEMRLAGDAALARAMSFEPTKTYQAAVTMMAIDMKRTPPGEADLLRSGRVERPVRNLSDAERAWMGKGATFLLETAAGPGKWNYPSKPAGGRFEPPKPDLSNSQYAVLGLLAADRCGVPLDDAVWLGGLRAFLQVQERDGRPVPGVLLSHAEAASGPGETVPGATAGAVRARGFPYRAGEACSGTMTCAGIASVAICRDVLRERGSRRLTPDLAADADRAVAEGFGWIHAHYTVEAAPHASGKPRRWLHYYLYALERAGILADVARVNGHDWYGDGALHLLLTQHEDGWWTEEPKSGPRKVADTCFALLFLKRAVTPVTAR